LLYKTISRFGEHFRDGQYSFVSFLFAVSAPRAEPFVKVGPCAPVPYMCRRRQCFHWLIRHSSSQHRIHTLPSVPRTVRGAEAGMCAWHMQIVVLWDIRQCKSFRCWGCSYDRRSSGGWNRIWLQTDV